MLTYGILVAVQEELKAFLRQMPQAEKESVGGISFYRGMLGGKAVILAKSGMGHERSEKTARALLEQYAPNAVLIAGFCGGLDPALSPGTLVLATEIRDTTIQGFPRVDSGRKLFPDPALRMRAEAVVVPGVELCRGALLTAAELAVFADQKRDFYVKYDHPVALDMETASAARVVQEAGVAWIAVRAVTDGANDTLPFDFQRYTDARTGEVDPMRLALAALLFPIGIPALLRLGRGAALAGRNLVTFVETYLKESPA